MQTNQNNRRYGRKLEGQQVQRTRSTIKSEQLRRKPSDREGTSSECCVRAQRNELPFSFDSQSLDLSMNILLLYVSVRMLEQDR